MHGGGWSAFIKEKYVMLDHLRKRGSFIGCANQLKEAEIVMVGAPMDFTSSFRGGSRFGPSAICDVSDVLETYSPELDRDLEEIQFYDAGDIGLPVGNSQSSLDMIYATINDIVKAEKTPVVLGGEHLITFPVIQVLSQKYPDLFVLQFDAHADLRDSYDGEKLSHATVMRRIVELIGGDRVFQFGIRSGTKEEFQYAKHNTHLIKGNVVEAIESFLRIIGNHPLYITFDIDVLDPAYAPGTGTPEPGGISSKELFSSIYCLQNVNIVGFDIVEVNPAFDSSQRTQILAAKVLREMVLIMSGVEL